MADTSVDVPTRTPWFSNLSRDERRTFWGCFGGWALDALDVQVYSLVLPGLLTLGFLTSKSEAGLIGTVTLLSSAVGGWLAGILADRFGRARLLMVTVAWYSVFTLLCGVAQSPVQLLVFRALMGLGFGGEWAAGAILMGETVRARYRGRAVGTVQSAWAIGWGIAVLLYVIIAQTLPASLAWRVLFFVGVLPALLVLYIRRRVREPQIFAARREERPAAAQGGFLGIFGPEQLRVTVLCALVAVGAQGGYYALTTWLPQFLQSARGLAILALGGTLALVIAGAFVGYLVGAWLTDRLGRRWTIVICAIGAFVVVVPFTTAALPVAAFTALSFPLGFFGSAYFSALGAFFTEQYPTALRGSGQGFCYNFGRGIGALFPLLVGVLADALSIGVAIAVFTAVAYALMAIAAVLLPETRGKELTE